MGQRGTRAHRSVLRLPLAVLAETVSSFHPAGWKAFLFILVLHSISSQFRAFRALGVLFMLDGWESLPPTSTGSLSGDECFG